MKSAEQRLINYINRFRLINKNDRLLLALSGGPDSVFALHFLIKFKRLFNIEIAAAHINHSLRGVESDEDEKFCRQICRELDLEFYSAVVDVRNYSDANKLSLEEAARNLRYEYLQKIAAENNFDKIVTAHNMNDNTETALINLFKGTSFKGTSGIPNLRDNIIRPFLAVSKEDILKILASEKIDFRIDLTNTDTKFTRNLIRQKIIPLIEEGINPNLNETIYRFSQLSSDLTKFIEAAAGEIAARYLNYANERLTVNINLILDNGIPGFTAVVKTGMKKYFGYELSFDELTKLKSLIENQAGKKIQLADNYCALRDRNEIVIFNETENEPFEEIYVKLGEKVNLIDFSFFSEIIDKPIERSAGGISEIIDADKLTGALKIRRWKNGDAFIPLGMRNKKKISDYLTDLKISSVDKKDQLLLLCGNDIVWVIGYRIDDRYKITDETRRYCKLWIE